MVTLEIPPQHSLVYCKSCQHLIYSTCGSTGSTIWSHQEPFFWVFYFNLTHPLLYNFCFMTIALHFQSHSSVLEPFILFPGSSSFRWSTFYYPGFTTIHVLPLILLSGVFAISFSIFHLLLLHFLDCPHSFFFLSQSRCYGYSNADILLWTVMLLLLMGFLGSYLYFLSVFTGNCVLESTPWCTILLSTRFSCSYSTLIYDLHFVSYKSLILSRYPDFFSVVLATAINSFLLCCSHPYTNWQLYPPVLLHLSFSYTWYLNCVGFLMRQNIPVFVDLKCVIFVL